MFKKSNRNCLTDQLAHKLWASYIQIPLIFIYCNAKIKSRSPSLLVRLFRFSFFAVVFLWPLFVFVPPELLLFHFYFVCVCVIYHLLGLGSLGLVKSVHSVHHTPISLNYYLCSTFKVISDYNFKYFFVVFLHATVIRLWRNMGNNEKLTTSVTTHFTRKSNTSSQYLSVWNYVLLVQKP